MIHRILLAAHARTQMTIYEYPIARVYARVSIPLRIMLKIRRHSTKTKIRV